MGNLFLGNFILQMSDHDLEDWFDDQNAAGQDVTAEAAKIGTHKYTKCAEGSFASTHEKTVGQIMCKVDGKLSVGSGIIIHCCGADLYQVLTSASCVWGMKDGAEKKGFFYL